MLIRKGVDKFKMSHKTLQLAMLYFDIVSNALLLKDSMFNWQLAALTSLILACKFLERDDQVPLISDMIKHLIVNATYASTKIVIRAT
jgi:Cyclin, N-terminal domain